MGKVNQLFQDAQQKAWLVLYDEYIRTHFGSRALSYEEHDEAEQYANDMMEQADAEREGPEPE